VSELPAGTVTLLFSDLEGSTRLLQRIGADRYSDVLSEHHRLLRDAVATSGGQEVDVQGEGFLFAFSRPSDALTAAIRAQRTLAMHGWPDDVELRVRMGVHTGEPTIAESGYVGIDIHRGARISAAAHGGQVLVSQTTRDLVDESEAFSFRDLGEHRLKDLLRAQHLFQVVAEGLDTAFPPLMSLNSRQTNLPVQATPLVGRSSELLELGDLIARSRLVTLTGPGGIGKTRLAVQAAADSVDEFDGGTYFVPLDSVVDSALVLASAASTIGVREGRDRPLVDALAERLSEKPVLLVLDNFEHVLDAAHDVSRLLERCEPLKVMTTSQEALRISAEQEYPVAPLADDDAHALFRERARAVRPDFQPTADDDGAVREICARVDCLPLALELAAARVKLLPPRELAARLDQRLSVLTAGARDRPSRQQTLRAAIEWSHGLLDEHERDLFARLAVFAGGWSLAAAEAVCDADLDLLGSLVDKSLVTQHEGPSGEPRFSMLETIREFAAERISERPDYGELRGRHAEYFAETTPDALLVRFQGSGRYTASFGRISIETDNLRAALAWAAETASELELKLAVLYQLSGHVGPTEGRAILEEALARSTAAGATRARGLLALGGLARMQGDLGEAEVRFEESLALYRAEGDAHGAMEALRRLASTTIDTGDFDRATELVDEADSIALDTGDTRLISYVAAFRATFPLFRGEYAEARAQMERVLALRESIGDAEGAAFTRGFLAFIMLLQGEISEALEGLEASLRFALEIAEFPNAIASSLRDLAAAFEAMGAVGSAVRTYAAGEAFLRARGVETTGPFRELDDRVLGPVRRAADDPRFGEERDAGEAMSLEEAAEYALETARRLREASAGRVTSSPP
jgi:predicted ATPase/class 3 adenylate cyclase